MIAGAHILLYHLQTKKKYLFENIQVLIFLCSEWKLCIISLKLKWFGSSFLYVGQVGIKKDS